MPSRSDVNVDNCQLSDLIQKHCPLSSMDAASATEVESYCIIGVVFVGKVSEGDEIEWP